MTLGSTRSRSCGVSIRSIAVGQLFQDEIASPLGLDVYIRLPSDSGVAPATIARPGLIEMLRGLGLRFMMEALNRH